MVCAYGVVWVYICIVATVDHKGIYFLHGIYHRSLSHTLTHTHMSTCTHAYTQTHAYMHRHTNMHAHDYRNGVDYTKLRLFQPIMLLLVTKMVLTLCNLHWWCSVLSSTNENIALYRYAGMIWLGIMYNVISLICTVINVSKYVCLFHTHISME